MPFVILILGTAVLLKHNKYVLYINNINSLSFNSFIIVI